MCGDVGIELPPCRPGFVNDLNILTVVEVDPPLFAVLFIQDFFDFPVFDDIREKESVLEKGEILGEIQQDLVDGFVVGSKGGCLGQYLFRIFRVLIGRIAWLAGCDPFQPLDGGFQVFFSRDFVLFMNVPVFVEDIHNVHDHFFFIPTDGNGIGLDRGKEDQAIFGIQDFREKIGKGIFKGLCDFGVMKGEDDVPSKVRNLGERSFPFFKAGDRSLDAVYPKRYVVFVQSR